MVDFRGRLHYNGTVCDFERTGVTATKRQLQIGERSDELFKHIDTCCGCIFH